MWKRLQELAHDDNPLSIHVMSEIRNAPETNLIFQYDPVEVQGKWKMVEIVNEG
jgi:ABC-type transporter MlaC component